MNTPWPAIPTPEIRDRQVNGHSDGIKRVEGLHGEKRKIADTALKPIAPKYFHP
jgi:hypothetical protein